MQPERGTRFGRTPPQALPGRALYDRAWGTSCMSVRLNLQYEGRGPGSARLTRMNPMKTTTPPTK